MNAIEDNTNKWKDTSCSWITRINVKITVFPKEIYGFSAIPMKLPVAFCTELEQINQNLYKNTRDSKQSNITENNKEGSIMHPDFKIYYSIKKATVIKSAWF